MTVLLQSTTWIVEQLTKALSKWIGNIGNQVITEFRSYANDILSPLIGTPGPKYRAGGPTGIAFRAADNGYWKQLIPNIYWEVVVGLALGIQFIGLAYYAIRYSSLSPVTQKQVPRRLFVAFLSIFFWLPVASLATQFFDAVGKVLATAGISDGEIIAFLLGTFQFVVSSGPLVFLFAIIAAYIWIKSLFWIVGRWLAVIFLTVAMPLIATFWAFEAWPLNRFAGLAGRIGGAYPGALAGALPAAFLLRVAVLVGVSSGSGFLGLPEEIAFFGILAIFWLAGKSHKYMLLESSRAVHQITREAKSTVGTAAGTAATAGVAGTYLAAGSKAGGVASAARDAVGPGRTPYGVHLAARNMNSGSRSSSYAPTQNSTIGIDTESLQSDINSQHQQTAASHQSAPEPHSAAERSSTTGSSGWSPRSSESAETEVAGGSSDVSRLGESFNQEKTAVTESDHPADYQQSVEWSESRAESDTSSTDSIAPPDERHRRDAPRDPRYDEEFYDNPGPPDPGVDEPTDTVGREIPDESDLASSNPDEVIDTGEDSANGSESDSSTTDDTTDSANNDQ